MYLFTFGDWIKSVIGSTRLDKRYKIWYNCRLGIGVCILIIDKIRGQRRSGARSTAPSVDWAGGWRGAGGVGMSV